MIKVCKKLNLTKIIKIVSTENDKSIKWKLTKTTKLKIKTIDSLKKRIITNKNYIFTTLDVSNK